ncbi:MAG: hypothetical protein ACP5C3_02085, partial [Methanomicrobiales archaeon]
VVTWTVPSLAAGASFTPTVTVTVDDGTQGTNIVNVATARNDQVPTPVQDDESIYVNNAVLEIEKSADRSPAVYNVGELVVYTVNVINTGPDAATGVVVTDTVPVGLTYVSSTLGGVYDPVTGVVTWTVPSLAAGASFTPTVTVTVEVIAHGQDITNIATARNDQVPTPVEDTETIHVNSADVGITKTASTLTPNYLDKLTYTITATNYGPDTATGVEVTDILPAGLKFISSTTTQGTYNSNTGIWDVGTIEKSKSAVLKIVVQVVKSNTSIENTATKTKENEYDPNPDNDSDSVTITVPTAADLAITKTVNNPRPTINDTIFFTYIVQNRGPDTAVESRVIDVLPAGLQYVSSSANYGSYNPQTGIWTIGDLPKDAVARLIIRCIVTRTGRITNKAKVESLTYDPILDDTVATATVDVQSKPKPANGKKIPMQKTGIPISIILIAILMVFAGIIVPKRKK